MLPAFGLPLHKVESSTLECYTAGMGAYRRRYITQHPQENRRGALSFHHPAVRLGLFYTIFVALLPFTASAQLLANLEPVMRLDTQWFEIHAPERLEPQARRLSSFADSDAQLLFDFLGLDPPQRRIPVLITDTEASLNGFSTVFPSNRIVIFIAAADPRGQLATMVDELRSVFFHELLHSLSLSERAGVWRWLAAIAGDWVAPTGMIMPQAMVEGTAVWVESRLLPVEKSGRLNDPAALALVALDRQTNGDRRLWDVSGLADHSGSGSLPYLYGGLFADYLAERFGRDILGRLWKEASKGNVFAGFDGTLLSRGIVDRATGEKPASLWRDFLSWLDAKFDIQGKADPRITEIAKGWFGPFAATPERIFVLDLERRAVRAVDLETFGKGGKVSFRSLFPADSTLRTIRYSEVTGSLELEWVRVRSDGMTVPAQYEYHLDSGQLSYQRDLQTPPPGEALGETLSKARVSTLAEPDRSTPGIFLHDAWLDAHTGYSYGLVRDGPRVLPARKIPPSANGQETSESFEILDIPGYAVRWISPGFRPVQESAGPPKGVQFALSLIPEGGIARLGVLFESDGVWNLAVWDDPPPGGVHQPAFISAGRVAFISARTKGSNALCIMNLDPGSVAARTVTWEPFVRKSGPPSVPLSDSISAQPHTEQHHAETTLRHFPHLFSPSLLPFSYASGVGAQLFAQDLTERLAWSLAGGADVLSGRPFMFAAVQLNAGTLSFAVEAGDRPVHYASLGRVSSLRAGSTLYIQRIPLHRMFQASLDAGIAAVQKSYPDSSVFSWTPDYHTWTVGLAFRYSNMHTSRARPGITQGFSLNIGTDYESAGLSLWGLSAGASAEASYWPLSLKATGVSKLAGAVSFMPAARQLSNGTDTIPSMRSTLWGFYAEYSSLKVDSPWFVMAEGSAKLFRLETGWIIPMPLLPSIALRRFTGSLGMRTAALAISGSPAALSSIYARLEADMALLAGMSATVHSLFSVEAAFLLNPEHADGARLKLMFGLGNYY